MKRAAVLLVMGFTALWAQSDDGPGRGVARISLLSGDVSVKRGDSGELTAAAINAPLVVEDRVYTGSGSRTELQFDWSNMIRLASDSEVRLAELESERYQIQIARGTVTFRVLRDSNAEVELSTPSISVRPLKQGEYRISVLDDGTSEITVRGGEADVYTPKGAERLRSGKTMLARGTAADPEFQLVRAIPEDDWDKWNERRDRDLTRSRSYDYVSRDIYGAEDLDAHGTWMNVAPYGNVWSPNVAVGWAPYRAGRWVWVDWYGWTWVSYDPWGWAPYHYGRWFYAGSRWCWYPGPRYGRSSWSPALVAFFGLGHGGVGVGFGNVGWVPLAPHETYHPWYGGRYYAGYRNGGYNSNNVTIVNNTNITNIYRNSRVTNGIMAVNASNFGRGRGGDYVRVAGNDLERANLVRGQMPLAPGRESLRMSDREIRSGAFTRSSNENQRFFSRREPSRVDRVPFEQQRRGVEQVARQTWRTDENGGGSQRSAAAAERGAGFARTVDANERTSGQRTAQDSGWRRVGDPSRGEAAAGSRAAESVRSQDAGGGWRRFGDPATRGESAVRGGGRRDTGAAGVESTEGNSRGAQRDSGDSWRRFGSPGAESQGGAQRNTEGVTRQENGWRRQSGANDGATRQNEAGRPERSNRFEGGGRTERFSSAPESRSESIRISPPIVRERQPDSGGSGRATSRGDMGGGMRSAPRGETGGGRMSGGGGGFSRGESGGGGGARSGGGGGGRSEGRSGGRGR